MYVEETSVYGPLWGLINCKLKFTLKADTTFKNRKHIYEYLKQR